MSLIGVAFTRKRTVWLMLMLLLVSGWQTFLHIPREATPDIALPMLYVSVGQEGISPTDADTLLVEPIAQELEGLAGLKQLKTTGSQGHASLMLEFEAGTDIKQALADVRERVNKARSLLPSGADEPYIDEINMALFPVLVINLSGQIDERILTNVARDLRDRLESIEEVLQVDITGNREEVLEVSIPPKYMQTYLLQHEPLLQRIQRNHRVVTAGSTDTGIGHYAIQVPGLIERLGEILQLPLAASQNSTLVFETIGQVERTFKDPTSLARTNGQQTITLEVKKRIGANIISAIDQSRAMISALAPHWPEGIEVTYSQDQSVSIKETLNDLTNNVIIATLLVMIIILANLGFRSAILVGIAIPGAFLTAVLILGALGYTLNMVVLFSLILAVGMLVDGAIVVTEYADRRMAEGADTNQAYLEAAQRMAWPIIASTATTLAAFMPLLFWPGITGEFMKYMPITLVTTLSASLAMALIAIPIVGSTIARRRDRRERMANQPVKTAPLTQLYLNMLEVALKYPKSILLLAIFILVSSFFLYAMMGKGVEFFPDTDADSISVTIRARGDLSIYEKDKLVRQVDSILLRVSSLKTINTRVISGTIQQDVPEDTIGLIQAELQPWYTRAHADAIVTQIRGYVQNLPGLFIEVEKRKDGPAQGRAIELILLGQDLEALKSSTQAVYKLLHEDTRLVDVRSSLPTPGIEWHFPIDRKIAARYGADVANIGNMVQMATRGIKAGEYRPGDTDQALDIVVRYPKAYRNLQTIENMQMSTDHGLVPLSYFTTRQAKARVSQIVRQDGRYMFKVEANPAPGLVADNLLEALLPRVQQILSPGILIKLGGDREQQQESAQFLKNAFSIALFIMGIILVTQFNSFYQTGLILSAIIFSTAGVLLGLLIKGEPFGIVMSGVGVIALAGIVVNNNIVLIDTFNVFIQQGMSVVNAARETCRQRLRPVLLTTITTVLGLIPMIFQLNIALLARNIAFNPPSAQWWTQLSTAIAGGLIFATVLTLFFTPSMLVLTHRKRGAQA